MRHLIESMDKISEAAPAASGPIDTAAQNVQSNWATIKQIPSNLKRLASDPVQYIKDLPAPSPEQLITGWAGGGLRSGGLLKGINVPGAAGAKSPMASMAQQLTQPSSTGGKITTTPTGIKHTADLPVLTSKVEPAAPAVWRNPRTGETSTTAPGVKQTTTAGPKETTPADLQKLANVPVTRTPEPGGRIEPKFDMDEEKIVPGTKFPGYWKGRDSAAKSRDRMVGDESIIPSLAKQAKEKTLEWQIEESYKQFKEQEYTGIDPIVRQRMGMQPATQSQIQSYLDKNPPGIKTGDGTAVTSGSGAPVQSGGQVDVARAADAASPDRAQSVAKLPAAPLNIRNRNDGTLPPLPAAAPAAAPNPVKPATAATVTSLPAAAPAAAPTTTAAPAKPMPTMPQKVAAGSWQDIWKNNPNIKNPNLIYAGQEIKLPNGTSAIVDKGDTLSSIAQRYRQGDYNVGTEVDSSSAATKTRSVAPLSTPASTAAKPQPAAPAVAVKPQPQPQQNQTAAPAAKTTASPNKPGVATSGPLKGINTTPLTRAEFERINANDRAAARARAGTPQNEAINKLAEQFAAFMEAQDEYGPEYQAMVQRVGQRARQGAMKTVWDPVKRVYKNVPVKQTKSVKEYENAQDQDSQVTSPPAPAATAASQTFVQDKELQNMNAQKTLEADAGAQDPNKQTTSPPSPAAVAQPAAPAAPDVSVATAKTTMAGLKPALGPDVDTNAAATGVTKANLGQQLNPAEQQAVSALTPLVMKAATIPSAAPQLRSALTNAGTMARATAAKQGKM
jgi:hypothetical protein